VYVYPCSLFEYGTLPETAGTDNGGIVVGKTMAFTSIQFKNSNDEVFARGSHTKYIALAWKDPKNITEELSPKTAKKE
jgi:hypothetical protein